MAKSDAALSNRNQKVMSQVSPLFDQLNKSWDKIEAFFRKEGILRPICLGIGEIEEWMGNDYQVVGSRLIGLQKDKGKWRVCYGVEYYLNCPDTEPTWTPVTDCGIELRTELLDHVKGLHEKLVKSNEEYIPEIEQAVAKSHDVLKDLGLSE